MSEERPAELLHVVLTHGKKILAEHLLRRLRSADHFRRRNLVAFRVGHEQHIRALNRIPADADRADVAQTVNR